MLSVAVCDDNKIFLDSMCRTVSEMFRKTGVSVSVSDYLSSAVFLEHHKLKPFDVVFIDIAAPDKDEFEIAEEIRKISENTYIFFIIIAVSLVCDSPDFRPLNFIPKASLEMFKERFYHVIQKLALHISANHSLYLEMAFGEKRCVKPSDIVFVTSKANYIDYFLLSGETLHVRGKIEDAEELLSPKLFVRIHNRRIINLAHLKSIDNPNNRVFMCGGQTLGVSRRYKKDLSSAYTRFIKNLVYTYHTGK